MRFLKNFTKAVAVLTLLTVPALAADAPVKLYPLVVHTQKTAQMFQVELADTPELQEHGLMDRTELANDHGMLFVFPVEQTVSFWMHNTLIPLDIIFIKQDNTISQIHAMAKPMDDTPIPSGGMIKSVLEIAGGQAAAQGLKIGDKVETPLLQDKK